MAKRHTPEEIITKLRQVDVLVAQGSSVADAVRPHASLGYRPPAPEVVVLTYAAWPAALTRPAPPAKLPVAPRPTVH